MTAEIVAMNKNAVALAADSAATWGDHVETYNTHNKLFALSKIHPIGIMIYARLELNGVPWETIIKLYRAQLGENSFPTVEEYMKDFLKFLEKNRKLFPKKDQARFYKSDIFSHLFELKQHLFNKLRNEGQNPENFDNIVLEHLKKTCLDLDKLPNHENFGKEFEDDLPNLLSFLKSKDIKELFLPFSIEEETCKALIKYIKLLILKECFQLGETGVVISGFGDDEFFPCTCHCRLGGFFNNKLKKSKIDITKISIDNSSCILPFAQGDMADAFVKGVHPQYEGYITDQIINNILETQYQTIEDIDDLTIEQKQKWHKALEKQPLKRLREMLDELDQHVYRAYIQPTLNGIALLPKDELASAAESLVNIASFKKSVSPGDNSVGGAIDVAVISKGDGLIWINRKHYFDPEKNPHFCAKYYRINK